MKYQSWWWRDIKKICREGGGEGWFKEELRWKLGRGDKISFWEDVWVGNTSLKTCFQRLYTLAANQEQKVEEAGGWEGSEWQWRLQWRRERFEWEAEIERSLLERVSGSAVKRYVNDTQVWGDEELERYTVSSAYTCLAKHLRGTQHVNFDLLWKASAFPNVLLTAWRVLIDRIPTREALVGRGVQMESTACVLCRTEEESSQHLFIECVIAQRVWSLCQKWLGIVLVQSNEIKPHFESFLCT